MSGREKDRKATDGMSWVKIIFDKKFVSNDRSRVEKKLKAENTRSWEWKKIESLRFGIKCQNMWFILKHINQCKPLFLGVFNGQISQRAVYWTENCLGLGCHRFGCGENAFTYG